MTSSATATDASAEVVVPLLEVCGVHKSYPTASGGSLNVLQGADLAIYPGEMVAVVGESGTGKSTLLHILGALDRPDAGEVTFRGESVFAKDDEALAAFRNRAIGFVFQFHHLLPEFTALENVCMPALIQGETLSKVEARALELLDTLGLADRSDHRPSALSGGEKQRVAIARALMNKPGLVLADEPTGNLDTKTADVLHQTLKALSRSTQQSFVIVTHNLGLAALADRALRLDNGRIETVAPDEVKLWTRLVM